MTMVNIVMGWLETVKVPTCDLDEVTDMNDEYIDKASAR